MKILYSYVFSLFLCTMGNVDRLKNGGRPGGRKRHRLLAGLTNQATTSIC